MDPSVAGKVGLSPPAQVPLKAVWVVTTGGRAAGSQDHSEDSTHWAGGGVQPALGGSRVGRWEAGVLADRAGGS